MRTQSRIMCTSSELKYIRWHTQKLQTIFLFLVWSYPQKVCVEHKYTELRRKKQNVICGCTVPFFQLWTNTNLRSHLLTILVVQRYECSADSVKLLHKDSLTFIHRHSVGNSESGSGSVAHHKCQSSRLIRLQSRSLGGAVNTTQLIRLSCSTC